MRRIEAIKCDTYYGTEVVFDKGKGVRTIKWSVILSSVP